MNVMRGTERCVRAVRLLAPSFRYGIAALAPLLLSCSSLDPLREANPEISEFGAVVWSRSHGVIDIFATPDDPSFSLPRRHRVSMRISTSSGDNESVAMYRSWCPPHRELAFYSCHSLLVFTRSGSTVGELEARIVEMGGRIGLGNESNSTWAEILFPNPTGLMERRRQLLAMPEVADVALDRPGCVDCGPSWVSQLRAALAAAIPLELGSPRPGDAVVQYAPGDTVSLRYSNPGGGEIVRSYVTTAP